MYIALTFLDNVTCECRSEYYVLGCELACSRQVFDGDGDIPAKNLSAAATSGICLP